MKKLLLMAVALVLLGACSTGGAESQPEGLAVENGDAIRELMVKSGVLQEIESLQDVWNSSLREGFDPSEGETTTKAKAVLKAWENLLSAEVAEARIYVELSKGMTIHDIEEVTRWFESPLGKKVVKMEVESMDKEYSEEEVARILKSSENPTVRKALIAQLMEETDTYNQVVSMGERFIFAILLGAFYSSGLDNLSIETVKMMAKEQADSFADEVMQEAYLDMIGTYGGLSNEELSQYVHFSSTKPAKTFNDILFSAFDAVMAQVGAEAGEVLGEIMNGTEARSLKEAPTSQCT